MSERGAGSADVAGRLPDFFVIGHEKCGTTALYRILRSHPEVFMPELKEPRFFSREPGPPPPGAAAGALPRTLEAYLELFAPARAEQLAGEASPQYIRSANAAARIAELQPRARAIALLREPVSFLRSFHLACVRSGQEDQRDLRKALELEPQRRRGERIPSGCRAPARLLYSEHVRYVEQLRRFEDALSRERVHVIVYDDLRRANERVARDALRFLGLDERLPIDVSRGGGSARKSVRNLTVHRLAIALKRARRRPDSAPAALRALDALTPAWLEAAARRALYAPPPPLDRRLAADLRARFEPDVAALGDHIGRDLLREWGYRG
ncbi:MAG TPA: sulfotransferase [Solirubrobacteraceae bacterium]|nr:sulfotransferase [Solirubrobacteraceae bacterium]